MNKNRWPTVRFCLLLLFFSILIVLMAVDFDTHTEMNEMQIKIDDLSAALDRAGSINNDILQELESLDGRYKALKEYAAGVERKMWALKRIASELVEKERRCINFCSGFVPYVRAACRAFEKVFAGGDL